MGGPIHATHQSIARPSWPDTRSARPGSCRRTPTCPSPPSRRYGDVNPAQSTLIVPNRAIFPPTQHSPQLPAQHWSARVTARWSNLATHHSITPSLRPPGGSSLIAPNRAQSCYFVPRRDAIPASCLVKIRHFPAPPSSNPVKPSQTIFQSPSSVGASAAIAIYCGFLHSIHNLWWFSDSTSPTADASKSEIRNPKSEIRNFTQTIPPPTPE
jgi:hypothetical protein